MRKQFLKEFIKTFLIIMVIDISLMLLGIELNRYFRYLLLLVIYVIVIFGYNKIIKRK